MYDMICLLICVFAVFGGYVALRVAAHALLRRALRARPDTVSSPDSCHSCTGCPKNGSTCKTDCTKD